MECFLVTGLTQRLWTRDIQIHDNRILPASYDHRLTWHVWAGIDFLMGYVRRNVDEISRVGLIAELQAVTPSHACTTSDDIDHCFQFSMMVGPVLACGWTTTVPAHSLLAPVRACVIAAARVIPGVWGVFESSPPACTIFTPCCFQSIGYLRVRRAAMAVDSPYGVSDTSTGRDGRTKSH